MESSESQKGYPLDDVQVEKAELLGIGADSMALLARDADGHECVLQVYLKPFLCHSNQSAVSQRLHKYKSDQNDFSGLVRQKSTFRTIVPTETTATILVKVSTRGDLCFLPVSRIPSGFLLEGIAGLSNAIPDLQNKIGQLKIPTSYNRDVAVGSSLEEPYFALTLARSNEYAVMNDGTLGDNGEVIGNLLRMAAEQLRNQLEAFNRSRHTQYSLDARNLRFFIQEGHLVVTLTDISPVLFPEIVDKRTAIHHMAKRFLQLKLA